MNNNKIVVKQKGYKMKEKNIMVAFKITGFPTTILFPFPA